MAAWSESSPQIKRAAERSARRSQARRTGNAVIDLAHEELENNPIMRSHNSLAVPNGVVFEVPASLKRFATYGSIAVASVVVAAGGYALSERLDHVLNPKIVTNEQVTTVPDPAHGPLASRTVTITTEKPNYGG